MIRNVIFLHNIITPLKTSHIYRDVIGMKKNGIKYDFYDKKESIDLESIHDSIGQFTYLNVEDGLTIGNDYFRFEKRF